MMRNGCTCPENRFLALILPEKFLYIQHFDIIQHQNIKYKMTVASVMHKLTPGKPILSVSVPLRCMHVLWIKRVKSYTIVICT